MRRQSISPKQRFRILQRDSFSCCYCGARPSDNVRLEIDHVVPVSRGGTNHDSNLATSCRDCNRGKRDVSPDYWTRAAGGHVAARNAEHADVLIGYRDYLKREPSGWFRRMVPPLVRACGSGMMLDVMGDAGERTPDITDRALVDRFIVMIEPPWDPDDGVPMPEYSEAH